MTHDTLSPGAVAVLAAIAAAGRPTTWSEVCERTGMNLNGVTWHVRKLKACGLVDYEPRKARTLRLACRLARE